MTYFRELPNLSYQTPFSDRSSSQDYVLVKNLFRRVKLRDDLKGSLTYLENWFLYQGGLTTYSNNFINNYLFPIVYPISLTTNFQIYLGIILIVINIFIYGLIFKNLKKK